MQIKYQRGQCINASANAEGGRPALCNLIPMIVQSTVTKVHVREYELQLRIIMGIRIKLKDAHDCEMRRATMATMHPQTQKQWAREYE